MTASTPKPTDYPERAIYEQLGHAAKSLASPTRLRILDVLEQGECTVEELARASGYGLKNTSAQLQQLRAAQLVSSRRDGVRIFYRIASPEVSRLLAAFEAFAENNVSAVRAEVEAYFAVPENLEPVTAEQLASRLDSDDVLVIDVRTADEYAKGHVPGAVSIPLAELTNRLDELPHDGRIIAYCQGPYCLASPKAVRLMAGSGIEARRMHGGITAWIRAGKDIDRARA